MRSKIVYLILAIVFSGNLMLFSQSLEEQPNHNKANEKNCEEPSEQLGVNASDGIFENYIRVFWRKKDKGNKFHVFRNDTGNSEDDIMLFLNKGSDLTTSYLYDRDVLPGVFYYYSVLSKDEKGALSAISEMDSGFIPAYPDIATAIPYQILPTAPDGMEVSLDWSPVLGAATFQVQIATIDTKNWSCTYGFATGIVLDTIISEATNFNWIFDIPGSYQWSVRAAESDLLSYFSEPEIFNTTEELLTTANQETAPFFIDQSNIKKKKNSIKYKFRYSSEPSKNQQLWTDLLIFSSNDAEFTKDDILLYRHKLDEPKGVAIISNVMTSPKAKLSQKLIVIPAIGKKLYFDQQVILENGK